MIAGIFFSVLFSAQGAERVQWQGSRIMGSPEPPSPYASEAVSPELIFKEPTHLDFLPDTGVGMVSQVDATLWTFAADFSAGSKKMVGDLRLLKPAANNCYSFVFDPGFITNRTFYVALSFRHTQGDWMRVSSLKLSPDGSVDLGSEVQLIDWPSGGHNGSSLQFGRDGMLYISSGDGEAPAPPDARHTGQGLDDLLASILRIDVHHAPAGKAYAIPRDNPFVNRPGIRPEIWAYGLRNPWKTCIDPRDGAMWIGDVGWESWEMVFRVDHPGFNGGWSIVEGPQAVNTSWTNGPTPIEKAVMVHPHTEGASITGGIIYRGLRLKDLYDSYIYGDWETGKIWEILYQDGRIVRHRELVDTPYRIIVFAEDRKHELYFMDYNAGGIHRLKPNASGATASASFPRLLSQTGLFKSASNYEFAPGVAPYRILAPSWADHGTADFALALPGNSRLVATTEYFTPPTNAVFVRTVSMEMTAGDPTTSRRIETQFFQYDGEWNGYTYKWKADGSDAELVPKEGLEDVLSVKDASAPGGLREQNWRYVSRTECMRCHMTRFGFLNAIIPEQLTIPPADNSASTEFARLVRLGLLEKTGTRVHPFKLANPTNTTASLELRARSWLTANCAHCHRENASGAVVMFLHAEEPLDKMMAVNQMPKRGTFGIDNPSIIAAGDPDHSALLYRTMTTGSGRMPILGSREVDRGGIKLLREWVQSLPGKQPDTNTRMIDDLVMKCALGLGESAVKVEETAANTSGALALAARLSSGSEPPSIRLTVARAASHSPNASVPPLFERFLPVSDRRKVLGAKPDRAAILALDGIYERGQKLFFGEGGLQCGTCHRIAGQGKELGPDLSRIAAKYERSALLEQILEPSKIVDPAWKIHNIETAGQLSLSGFLTGGAAGTFQFKAADGTELVLKTKDIASDKVQEVSLMPEGLLQSSTAQEAADLLAYLGQLK